MLQLVARFRAWNRNVIDLDLIERTKSQISLLHSIGAEAIMLITKNQYGEESSCGSKQSINFDFAFYAWRMRLFALYQAS